MSREEVFEFLNQLGRDCGFGSRLSQSLGRSCFCSRQSCQVLLSTRVRLPWAHRPRAKIKYYFFTTACMYISVLLHHSLHVHQFNSLPTKLACTSMYFFTNNLPVHQCTSSPAKLACTSMYLFTNKTCMYINVLLHQQLTCTSMYFFTPNMHVHKCTSLPNNLHVDQCTLPLHHYLHVHQWLLHSPLTKHKSTPKRV